MMKVQERSVPRITLIYFPYELLCTALLFSHVGDTSHLAVIIQPLHSLYITYDTTPCLTSLVCHIPPPPFCPARMTSDITPPGVLSRNMKYSPAVAFQHGLELCGCDFTGSHRGESQICCTKAFRRSVPKAAPLPSPQW